MKLLDAINEAMLDTSLEIGRTEWADSILLSRQDLEADDWEVFVVAEDENEDEDEGD